MKRRVFYSFHYQPDNWRAAQVRSMGVIKGNQPATGNKWEKVKKGGDEAIDQWISAQLLRRTCTVVLVGTRTARRKWIDHEIIKSWEKGMGVVGIRIHGLKDRNKRASKRGSNPFDGIEFDNSGRKLSSVVRCYDPKGRNSRERYNLIREYLADVVEEAISMRKRS